MQPIFENLLKIRKDPRKRMTTLLDIAALAAGYYFFFIYQDIFRLNIPLISLKSLLAIPLIPMLILPLIHYLIIKPDPLQRSPSNNKKIRFYQNEFPSLYILNRCSKCVENETTCPNYIKKESMAHAKYWFHDIFHGPIEEEDPHIINDTFEKGYTCKLMCYTYWILFTFSILAILTVFFQILLKFIISNDIIISLTPLQIISPFLGFIILIIISNLNKADTDKPSGCWHAWREINMFHIHWLCSNEKFLVNLICKKNGVKKRFNEK